MFCKSSLCSNTIFFSLQSKMSYNVINFKELKSINLNRRTLAVMVSFIHIITVAAPAPVPEDWSPGSFPLSEEHHNDMFISAFINVSYFNNINKEWVWDRAEVGRYGGGYVGPASGEIVHITSIKNPKDHNGCETPFKSTRSDRRLPDPGEPWIALIKRGGCNFEVKVNNAFRSNAAGVIIYNDRDSDALEKMKLSSDSGRKYF